MRPASQRFFIHSYIYLRILIVSYLATFLGTNSLFVLMCRKAVNQSISIVRVCQTVGFVNNFKRQIEYKHNLCMYLKGNADDS